MSKFIINEDFFEIFPHAKIGIVLAKNISNAGESSAIIKNQLAEANNSAKQHITAEVFSDNSAVSVWRQAYQKFKTKKGARCSIEAMLKRIQGGNEIRSINPLVDIYNTVSLTYAFPCGGEDLDTFVGDMYLTEADGNEPFVPLGGDENESPYPGEIIYKDDEGAICRCWNWRESQRTMLTENTKNAFLILEYCDDSRMDDFKSALKSLQDSVQENLGGELQTFIMDTDHREIEL